MTTDFAKDVEIIDRNIHNTTFKGKTREQVKDMITNPSMTPKAKEMAEYIYEFWDLLQMEKSWDREKIEVKELKIDTSLIKQGNRNRSLFLIAYNLNRSGYDEDAANERLKEINQQIAEPLDEKEIEGIIKSAFKYKIKRKTEKKKTFDVMFNRLTQAEECYEDNPFFYDRGGLFWFWNLDESKYEVLDETDVMNRLEAEFGSLSIKASIKQEILEALRRVGRKKMPKNAKKTWLQTKSGVYDCETGELFDSSPEYFLTNPIPWFVGKTTETPNMDRVFAEWVGKEWVQTLYEILAYCLLPDYPIHRIFCLIGSGMNGKSKFLDLLKRFIGLDNVSSTQLDMIAGNGKSRFETIKLYKKLVCVMGETNFNLMSETNVLKQITGQDLVSFEMKGKTPFSDVSYAKIVIATNSLPPTTDKTVGFYRRWMIIDFPNTFTEKKDILAEIPEQEYENLLSKCFCLLTDLLKKGEFSNEGSIEQRKQRYEDKSDPLQKFLTERTIKNIDEHVFKYDLTDEFVAWTKKNGHRQWSDREITGRMRELGFEEAQKGEKRYRAWLGISWKDKLTDWANTLNTLNSNSNSFSYIEKRVETGVQSVQSVHLDDKPDLTSLLISILGDKSEQKAQYEELLSVGISTKTIEEAKEKGIVFENPKGTIRLI